MTELAKVFGSRHAVLPVIHVESLAQALNNAAVARRCGCDGVFLINHGMPADALLEIHRAVYAAHPGWWVGVNCLDLPPHEVFSRIGANVAGVWVDNAGIDERDEIQPQAETIRRAREASGWRGLYFGGVAFKYQRAPQDLARAAHTATRYMDVVTTSGPGTGQAASTEKLAAMRQAVGDFPLALASGVTVDNIYECLPYVDCVLVATGVSSSWSELDPQKLSDLVSSVRLYRHVGEEQARRAWAQGIRLTQDLTFETDNLASLEWMLVAAMPLLAGGPAWTSSYVVSGPDQDDDYPSECAARYLGFGRDGGLESGGHALHWPVCAIRAGAVREAAEYGFSSSELAARAVVRLLAGTDPRPFLSTCTSSGPFARADGSVRVGFRLHFSCWGGDKLLVSLCHVLYHK